ncbi:hypothetical protein ACFQ0G_38205 [Streptomyces chiangmaiensis]
MQTPHHPGTGTGPQEFIGAHDVTDGARLAEVPENDVVTHLKTHSGTPPMTPAEEKVLRRHLQALHDDLDAVADLLLAESVHQFIQGNHDRAGATLESLAAGGQAPPRPQVLDTPRRGIPVGHRVLVVIPENTTRQPGWDGTQQIERPRARAEPLLDTWAGHQLGAPGRIRLRAAWPRPGQQPDAPTTTVTEHTWPLTDHCALDVVALAAAGRLRTAIEHELLGRRPADVPDGTVPVLRPGRDPGWSRTTLDITQIEALGTAVAGVLTTGRPGTAADLAPAQSTPLAEEDPQLRVRAEEALDGLQAALDAQDLMALAAYGVTGPPASTADELADQLTGALGKARERLARARQEHEPDQLTGALGKARERLARAQQEHERTQWRPAVVLEAVFGSGGWGLGIVTPPDAGTLDASFGPGLERGGDPLLVPGDWVEQMATVRPGTSALADLLLHTRAAGTGHTLRVGQTPFTPDDRWVGALREPEDEDSPATGLVVHGPAQPLSAGRAAVLVVDEWSELIPAQRHTAGVTFHYDAPGARAPQAVLLAVPPTVGQPWTPDALAAAIGEALDLAKLRLVDLQALGWLGRYLPAAYLPETAMGTAPSVNIRDVMKRADLKPIVQLLSDEEA